MLLIVTSTSEELLVVSTLMTSNNLEPPRYKVLVWLAVVGCGAHFKSELRRNY